MFSITPRLTLDPTMLCRELIMLMLKMHAKGRGLPTGVSAFCISEDIELLEVELEQSLDWYSANILVEVAVKLLDKIPQGGKIVGDSLALPAGADSGWECYDCVGVRWIRAVIDSRDMLRFDMRYFI